MGSSLLTLKLSTNFTKSIKLLSVNVSLHSIFHGNSVSIASLEEKIQTINVLWGLEKSSSVHSWSLFKSIDLRLEVGGNCQETFT